MSTLNEAAAAAAATFKRRDERPYTAPEVEAEAWFGGQKERVLATVALVTDLRTTEQMLSDDDDACHRLLDAALGEGSLGTTSMETLLERLPRLIAMVTDLRAWQLAVADGLGFVNRAEGQSGYEVASPEVIVGYVKGLERDSNIETLYAAQAELAAEQQMQAALQESLATEKAAHLATSNACMEAEADRARLEAELAESEGRVANLIADVFEALKERDAARLNVPTDEHVVLLRADYERLVASLPAGPRVVR